MKLPNKITAANAGIALSFHVGRRSPGVVEFCRSPKTIYALAATPLLWAAWFYLYVFRLC